MSAMFLCDDLMFSSRVTATARALGLPVQLIRTPENLIAWVRAQPPACVIVDLHVEGLAVDALVRDLPEPRPLLVGFGSHVDTATLNAARAAGFDKVMPRSQFAQDLESALPQWCAGEKSSIQ